MKRRSFLVGLLGVAVGTTLLVDLVGTPDKIPPIHPDQLKELEDWIRAELEKKMNEAVDRYYFFGELPK
jgi:hypothetical protein